MSTLKVDNIRHNSATSDAITMASDGTCTAKVTSVGGGQLSHRNIIVNGGMKVAQRSVSEAITGAGYHTVDRFKTVANSSMTYAVTMSQENDNPDGLGKSVKLLTTTASTPTGSENYCLRYTGEEQDISGAGLGTSSCKQLTISFSVKTNKTGTHGFQIYIGNNQPNMTVAYTVSSANTWERKTITLPTYTSSYSHLSDNAKGFMIDWNLASGPDDIMAPYNWATGSTAARGVTGQVNMLDTVGNYFQLTNVQLEIGDTATSFEHRIITEELLRCYRYYYKVQPAQGAYFGSGFWYNSNIFICHIDFPVVMRTNITSLEQSGTAAHYKVIANATTYTCTSVPSFLGDPNNTSQSVNFRFSGNGTQGQGGLGRSGNTLAFLAFSAEL